MLEKNKYAMEYIAVDDSVGHRSTSPHSVKSITQRISIHLRFFSVKKSQMLSEEMNTHIMSKFSCCKLHISYQSTSLSSILIVTVSVSLITAAISESWLPNIERSLIFAIIINNQ